MEKWKQIKDYPNYQVSNTGRVKSKRKELSLIVKKRDGYVCVTLSKNGVQKQFTVHRLVAEHFIENNGKKFVNHLDENKTNNNFYNLEWCTAQENQRHSFAKQVTQKDLKGNVVKVDEALVDVEKFGFSHINVLRCCRGLRKTHKNYTWSYE